MENSTSFTLDPNELKKKNLGYGQNKRSSEHLNYMEKNPLIKKYMKNIYLTRKLKT